VNKQTRFITLMMFVLSPVVSAQPPMQIEEIAVIGQFVPDEKRGTDQIANVVGQEQFTRSGDSNIAESLKRVSGLSTVGGKYIFVRGLGSRYSTTLLNGAILPSPEPINRVVPMDLFPTSILESVLVQKTYSASYPAEFGGGVLQMRTKKSSEGFFWDFATTLGMTQDENFSDGLRIDGGGRDWLGKDDGTRQPSAELVTATGDGFKLTPYSQFTGEGQSPEVLESIGEQFRDVYTPTAESLPANFSANTSLGNSHEIGSGGTVVNYLASISYSNSWDLAEIEDNDFVPSTTGLEQQKGLNTSQTENSIDVSAIFSAGIDFNQNQNIRFTSLGLRKTDDRVSSTTGFTESGDGLDQTDIEWVERELISNQVQGDHFFPDFHESVINWRYSKINATRNAPDNIRYKRAFGELSNRVDGNIRNFMTLEDQADEFGLDFTSVFYGPYNAIITPQIGYVKSEKTRQSDIRRFGFSFKGAVSRDLELLKRPLEEIFTPENIDPSGFQIREITRANDSYSSNNSLEAFYGQVEFNFDDRFRFTAGARQEDFFQESITYDVFSPDTQVVGAIKTKQLLPSLNATYIHYDHQFRAAYSETVSRPDFRELSPSSFTNPDTRREVLGNPNLKPTDIKNYDLRWEWYFAFSDYVSVGLFYKELLNPIEASIFNGSDRRTTYINAQSAENTGIEVELYKRLDFLGGFGEDFYVQTNISKIQSSVTIGEEQQGILTSSDRPLQGQSDWLFNFQVGYEPFSGTTATLLYHYYGDRIDQVGIESAPDLIEEGFGELNFVFIRELNDHWQITAKARNLMNERNITTQGGHVTFGYFRGRELSVQAQYKF
jgi:outer membrane receptor protein involved in Fe transport